MTDMPLSLTEAATALRDGAMTSVELITAALRRADTFDAGHEVYLSRFDGRAMDAACRADADFAVGRDRGLLQGIPIGLEDVGADAGPAVEPRAVLDPAWMAEREAPVAARIRRAGAVITGKVSRSATGPGVAAGLFLASVGPDTADGILRPAATCGISGLVGCGRDHVAPLARSARDCAAILGVIAGPHPGPGGGDDGTDGRYLGALCGSLAGVRLGVDRAPVKPGDPDDPASLDDAVAVLGDLGADLVEVALPAWSPGASGTGRAFRAEVAAAFAHVDVIVGATTAEAPGYDDRPVLIVPMGYGSRGLPLSLQIAGRPSAEATVLRVGDAYQQITDWHRQIPDRAWA